MLGGFTSIEQFHSFCHLNFFLHRKLLSGWRQASDVRTTRSTVHTRLFITYPYSTSSRKKTMEGEVEEEEMQQVAAISQDGETFYVQIPKSIHIGANNMVTSEVDENGQQIIRIVEVEQKPENQEEGMLMEVVGGDVPELRDSPSGTLDEVQEEVLNDNTTITTHILPTDDLQPEPNVTVEVINPGLNPPEMADNEKPASVGPISQPSEVTVPTDPNKANFTPTDGSEGIVTVAELASYDSQQLTLEGGDRGGQDVEIFQEAMTLLQEKSGSDTTPATYITGADGSNSTVYIVHESNEDISLETAEALKQAGEGQVMVLAPTGGQDQQAETLDIHGVQDVVTPHHQDTVNVTATKKRRGRPRKIKTAPVQNVARTEPEVDEREEEVEFTSAGRPRRKAAKKFLEICKAMNRKGETEAEVEERISPPPTPVPKSVQMRPAISRENKENMSPAANTDNLTTEAERGQASVNITVHDKAALQVLDDVGIYMMYYCRRCTFFSRRLQDLTTHILDCRQRQLTPSERRRAETAVLSNAILSQAAVKGIAEADLEAIKTACVGCIAIDEHNYADVVFQAEEEKEGEQQQVMEEQLAGTVDDEQQRVEEGPEEDLPEELRPRKWFCLDCPDIIYSEKDLEIHRRCHGENGLDPLHCCLCGLKDGENEKAEWRDVRKHLTDHHQVQFELLCHYCSEKCTDHENYIQHVRTHSQLCERPDCGFITDNDETLSLHQSSHVAGSSTFVCSMCKHPAPDWTALREHFNHDHPGIICLLYGCMDCVKCFQDQPSFQRHMVANTTTGKITCHLCAENFSLCALPGHLRTEHGDADGEEAAQAIETVASECPMKSDRAARTDGMTDELMEVQEGNVHGKGQGEESKDREVAEVAPPFVGKKYHCPQHELVFYSQGELTKHYMEVHWGVTTERVRKAEETKKREREGKLVTAPAPPVRRGPGRPRKKLQADEDDSKDPDFKISRFSSHRKIRPGGHGSAKCRHCYKKFANSESLTRHITHTHSGDKLKPVECSYCHKPFRNGIQLRNHVRVVHEGIKRAQSDKKKPFYKKKTYICETCGYTTPELNRLTNHKMSVHNGNFPFHCTLCDYKTNERADMKRHEHKHKGIKRYSCEYCSYKSDQRWLLVNHCSRQHGVHLTRITRNTKGALHGSNRRRRREDEEGVTVGEILPTVIEPTVIEPTVIETDGAFTQEIVIGGDVNQLAEGYFVPVVTTNEHGEETVSMVAVGGAGEGASLPQGEVATIETVEETRPGEVVYIQEDGTIINPQEGSIMLVTVGPDGTPAVSEQIAHPYT